MAPRKRIKIRAQEPEMDRERVLDLLGNPFEGDYVGGSAEWLKNSLDHSIRTGEVDEPVILFRISTPRNRRSEWVMECIDFIGTTYDEINEHLKMWGSEIAASRGRTDWAGFGGHGNGGKFHMRQNFETSEFVTYFAGHLTVFGFDRDRRYGFDETYKGEVVDPDLALKVADIDPESLPVPQEIKERLKSGDPARCRFTVVRGRGFTQVRRWRKRETFDEKLQAHGQAKQVLDRAHVIYVSDNEVIDGLKPPVIASRTGYEEGRVVTVPSNLEFDGETYQLTTEETAGSLTLRVAEEPFRRNDASHMIDVRGKHGLIIATYRVTELPLRNRVGADFIFGEMSCVALDDLGLRQNDRAKLVPTEITDALLIWLADRIDELSDELAEAENRQRRERDVQATLELSNRLNRWKNRFLKAREIFVEVGASLGTGEGGSGGGGTGGTGPTRTGDGGEGGGGNGGTGQGEGGAGSDTGGGGSGEDRRRAARFPTILVSGYDPDPDTQEKFDLHPRQPVVYQRIDDIDRNLWWVNAQRPLAERIINEEPEGADSSRWRDYVFNRFVEVIQAYDVRERWDGTTDLAEYQWRLEGDIHDSAAAELADVLFGPEGLSGAVSEDESEGEELGAPSLD